MYPKIPLAHTYMQHTGAIVQCRYVSLVSYEIILRDIFITVSEYFFLETQFFKGCSQKCFFYTFLKKNINNINERTD